MPPAPLHLPYPCVSNFRALILSHFCVFFMLSYTRTTHPLFIVPPAAFTSFRIPASPISTPSSCCISASSACCHIPVPPFLFPSLHLPPLHLSVFLFLPHPYSLIFHNCAPGLFRHIPVPSPACQRSAPVTSRLYFARHILPSSCISLLAPDASFRIPVSAAVLLRITFFQR